MTKQGIILLLIVLLVPVHALAAEVNNGTHLIVSIGPLGSMPGGFDPECDSFNREEYAFFHNSQM